MADEAREPGAGTGVAVVDEEALRGRIHEIRGQRVMLDFDLAEIYGYTTKAFNQQVQRNIEKFDEDFMFRLTEEEAIDLRSQNVTANLSSMSRALPFAFTEQGIYMLMTVLRGEPDERVFVCGASSKDAGRRATVIFESTMPWAYRTLADDLLSRPELAL